MALVSDTYTHFKTYQWWPSHQARWAGQGATSCHKLDVYGQMVDGEFQARSWYYRLPHDPVGYPVSPELGEALIQQCFKHAEGAVSSQEIKEPAEPDDLA